MNISIVQELWSEEWVRAFGLDRLTPEQREGLVVWILATIERVERDAVRLGTVRAIRRDGQLVEFEDGTAFMVQEGDERVAATLSLGDFVLQAGTRAIRLDAGEHAMLRRLLAADADAAPTAEPAADDELRGQLREVIDQGAATMNRSVIAGRSFVVQFRFVGPGAGEYFWRVQDGVPSAHEGWAEDVTMLVEVRGDEFFDIVRGRVDGQKAYDEGRMRMIGDRAMIELWGQLFG